jgi:hypothetical protein
MDACRESLTLGADDLAVGLHACGELGDRLVTAAAEARCQVALVSCCLQKIRSPQRAALSARASDLGFDRETLGLTNLTSRACGVEASLDNNLRARETRYALGNLLRNRGESVEPGAEMRGINRRRAHLGLREVAERALALRGLRAPSNAEIHEQETLARHDYAVMRRLSLPRNLLARLVEVAVVLDRASALSEAGLAVRVALLVHRSVTPRNLAIFASASADALPKTSTRDPICFGTA